MTQSVILLHILIVCVLTFSHGCAMYPDDPSGLDKYRKIGDSEQLGEWALQQTDSGRVDGAIHVLLERVERDGDPDAAFALANIYLKLADGWPGYQMPSGATEGDYVEKDKRSRMEVIQWNLGRHINTVPAAAEALRIIGGTD